MINRQIGFARAVDKRFFVYFKVNQTHTKGAEAFERMVNLLLSNRRSWLELASDLSGQVLSNQLLIILVINYVLLVSSVS